MAGPDSRGLITVPMRGNGAAPAGLSNEMVGGFRFGKATTINQQNKSFIKDSKS